MNAHILRQSIFFNAGRSDKKTQVTVLENDLTNLEQRITRFSVCIWTEELGLTEHHKPSIGAHSAPN